MNAKLQELTDKLYQEGVQKGQSEAEKILTDAKAQASKIIAEAKAEAENRLAEGQKKSDELRSNVQAELQMATRQCITSLKQQITGLIATKVASGAVAEALNSREFLAGVIQSVAKNWQTAEGTVIQLPANLDADIRKFLETQISSALAGGVTVEYVKDIKTGFLIQPADGSYKVSFTEESITGFFKEFLRPKLVEMLYQ